MSRRGHHMTWRVFKDEPNTTSLDAQLQALAIDPINSSAATTRYRWVTVARGNPEDLRDIAEALNRARVLHFDISPEAKEMLYVHAHSDGALGDGGSGVRKRRRKLPGGQMARRGRTSTRNKHA